jgi:hypothetical protein
MNEEMQSKVLEYLQGMESRLGKAEGFVIEQAPLYVQELLVWHFWLYASTAIAAFIAGVALLIPCVLLVRHMIKQGDEGDRAFSICVSVLIMCLPVVIGLGTAKQAIKAKVAPRLVVVEHIKGQMK